MGDLRINPGGGMAVVTDRGSNAMKKTNKILSEKQAEAYPDNNPKTIFGLKKPPIHLIPPAALIHEAMAMKYGAYRAGKNGAGYGPFNWREAGIAATVYIDAILRHVLKLLDGEDYALDSKVHHMAHVRANAGIYLDAMEAGKLIDDRPPKGIASDLIDRLTIKTEKPDDEEHNPF